jgi:hypothetical protein
VVVDEVRAPQKADFAAVDHQRSDHLDVARIGTNSQQFEFRIRPELRPPQFLPSQRIEECRFGAPIDKVLPVTGEFFEVSLLGSGCATGQYSGRTLFRNLIEEPGAGFLVGRREI